MNERILELLYRSFDGELTAGEGRELREALAVSEALRHEKDRIEAMRKMVSASGRGTFKPFFAERVMRRVAGLREGSNGIWTLQEWLSRIFRRVAIAGAAVAAALVILNLVQADGVSLAAAFGISEVPIEEILELPVESILEDLS
jgi:anti-sigma factor RsiW